MIQSRAIRRALLALLLGAHAVGALVPLADAQVEASGRSPHFEAENRDDGPRPHAHGDCALCMHLAQLGDVAGPAVTLAAFPVVHAPGPAVRLDSPSDPAAPRRGGRGPPLG